MEQTLGEAAPGITANGVKPPNRINRRVGLPTGRAVVGALLVTLAVVGLFASFRRSQATTGSPYVVVAQTVPAGQVVTEADLAVRELDIGELADRTFTSRQQAIGGVAVQTLLPGQLLQEGNLLPPAAEDGATPFELSFAVDRSRALNGSLIPGEVVDVVATLKSSGTSCSFVVVPRARVVAVRGGGESEVLSTSGSVTVTVSIDRSADVLGLVHAVDEADITIIRSTRAPDVPLDGAFCGDAAVDQANSDPGDATADQVSSNG